jgi:predicted Zn-dependent peptidase
VLTKILLDYIAGDSSLLYEKLYSDSILGASFAMDYLSGKNYGVSVFSGASPEPEAVRDSIINEINRLTVSGLDQKRFDTIKRKQLGRFIQSFNSISKICTTQADLYAKDLDLFDLMRSFDNCTLDLAEARLKEHFINPVLSIIYPPE